MTDVVTDRDIALEQLCINTVRALAMDAVQQAESGHPGTAMALAPLAWVLWQRHLRHNPANPEWLDRDRFVLSCGHACMLLYSVLYLTGYDLPLEEIKRFRQWGSRTPGHPEVGLKAPATNLCGGDCKLVAAKPIRSVQRYLDTSDRMVVVIHTPVDESG